MDPARHSGARRAFEAYRSKLAEELRGEWAAVLLYRPVSLVLAPALVALGVAPLAITLGALAVALSLPWLALLVQPPAYPWVGAAAIGFCILDCLDGDVARTSGRVTELGAYADFLVDLVYRVSFYAAIGMLYDRQGDPGWGPLNGAAIGVGAAALALIARACRLHAANRAGARHRSEGSENTGGTALYAFLSGLDHLLPVLLIIAGAAGRLDWLLAWIVVYSLGDLGATQLSILRRLR